jgi:hypothetical protein
MKDFTNELVDLIIENEKENLDKIMNEVTQKITADFARETYRLLDQYYDNYTPIRYVRVYGKKRKLRTKSGTTKRKPKAGQVSLHAAITRGGEDAPAIGVTGGSYEDGYVGGIVLDPDKFKVNGMRHIGKGKDFTEWDIVKNFMFAGEGGYGDIRSYVDYNHPSADTELGLFMDSYEPTVDKYYNDALKNVR